MAFTIKKSKDTEEAAKKAAQYDSPYTESARVADARAQSDTYLKSIQSDVWDGGTGGSKLKAVTAQIAAQKPFQYDLNGDMLYQQYKDRYINLGRQAMMDTIGQTTALTGGYANSYAQQAGQQAYQGYLQGLNDKIPELYGLAMDKYRLDQDTLNNKYSVLSADQQRQYGEWRDAKNDKVNMYGILEDRANNLADTERGDYYTNRDYYNNRESTLYGRDATLAQLAQEQANADRNFAEEQRQFNVNANEKAREFDAGNALDWAALGQKQAAAVQSQYPVYEKVPSISNVPTDTIAEIENNLALYGGNNNDVAAELQGAIDDGKITPAQAQELYAAYATPLSEGATNIFNMDRFGSVDNETLEELAKNVAKLKKDEDLKDYIYGDGTNANKGLVGNRTVTQQQGDDLYTYARLSHIKGLGDIAPQYVDEISKAISVDNNDDLYMNLGDLVMSGAITENQAELLYSAFAVPNTKGTGTGKGKSTNIYTQQKYSNK